MRGCSILGRSGARFTRGERTVFTFGMRNFICNVLKLMDSVLVSHRDE